MRVRIDRGAEAVRVAFTDAPEGRRVEVADGVAISYDAAGGIAAIEVRGVDGAALHEFSVELAGLADRPVSPPTSPPAAPARLAPDGRMRGAPEPAPPGPAYYGGPLSWDPEAEAAIQQIPFFSRGKARLDAGTLARRRGSERVTLEIVQAAGGG